MADLRRDRDAFEVAMDETMAAQPVADEGKLAGFQSVLDECLASSKSLLAQRDAAKMLLAAKEGAPAPLTAVPAFPTAAASTDKPIGAVSAVAPSDDLKQISGTILELEGLLIKTSHSRFQKIADLAPGQAAAVFDILHFYGLIEREN